jgi:cytochrome c oxidase accessory protein FixG
MESPQPVVVNLYQAHKKLYPKTVHGQFARWRWALVWFTQLLYYGLAWLPWGDRPAVLFDLASRKFYIFSLVLYPQDFIYLTGLLVISAYSLFFFTAIAGRLWCGYACPQTVYTEMFLWIEQKTEGDRSARIRLDQSPWSLRKLRIKASKHLLWLALALWTGITFVGYFVPIRELLHELLSFEIGGWSAFWVFFYAFATWGNAGFMREQVCKYMCPYARFQSAMFDDDTLIVTYDEARGEPRGGRSRKDDLNTKQLGSCIDCNLCVQVCPTGIDIRKGLQYECIGCGACADVCDTVMDKMGYERGLVKYSTQNAINNKWSHQQMLKRILRPRVLIYATVLSLLVVGLVASLWFRTPFRVDVVRDRGVMARLSDDGKLENVYRLQIMNGTEAVQHYQLSVTGIKDLEVETEAANDDQDDEEHIKTIKVKPAESRWVIVDLKIPDGTLESGSHKIMFEIESLETKDVVTEKSVFLVPR